MRFFRLLIRGKLSHRTMTLAIFFTEDFGRGLSAIQNIKHLAGLSLAQLTLPSFLVNL